MFFKLLLLILTTYLRRKTGFGGVYLLVAYFFYRLYSVRYRGYHGRLTKEEVGTLSLTDDVDKHSMRQQWDVVPWPGTSKHVIRKWTWDKIALQVALEDGLRESSAQLDDALDRLVNFTKQHGLRSTKSQYSGTLALVDDEHSKSHSPQSAQTLLLNTFHLSSKKWTDKALCTLGGTFIICAEGYKDIVKDLGHTSRMKRGTEETSRLTWKTGQLVLNPGLGSLVAFGKALLARINPWDAHAVVLYENKPYYAPTTMFGASATMMKVMNFCDALKLSKEGRQLVGYCVAWHWIDKYLNDDSWTLGGGLTPDRHSLLEALQGMYAHIEQDPVKAATKLVEMYERAEEQRKRSD